MVDTIATFADENGNTQGFPTDLTFSTDDPFAARILFHQQDGTSLEWSAAFSMLKAASEGRTDEITVGGDLNFWPVDDKKMVTGKINVVNGNGHEQATFFLPHAAVEDFIRLAEESMQRSPFSVAEVSRMLAETVIARIRSGK